MSKGRGRGRGRGRGGDDDDDRRERDDRSGNSGAGSSGSGGSGSGSSNSGSGSGSGGSRSRIDFTRSNAAGNGDFDSFSCDVHDNGFDTPDRLRPDRIIERDGANSLKIEMPDGEDIEFWNFEDPEDSDSSDEFPSRPIRVRQGEVVHTILNGKKNSHTIHHHGIEPTTFNDGVGHTSFEVKSDYAYQWCPSTAGTFFYHCHKNTTLHFEMGMYGLIIVDPPEGPGHVYSGGPTYDIEAFWVVDDVDPRWRDLNHSAGLCDEGAGLNDFNPKYFMVTGVPNHRTRRDRRVRVTARVGETILIRFLNASYSVVRTTIEGLDAECVAVDGHPLGHPDRPWAQPYTVHAGEPYDSVSAQRQDYLIHATTPGIYPVRFEFRHWITGEIHDNGRGVAETEIEIRA